MADDILKTLQKKTLSERLRDAGVQEEQIRTIIRARNQKFQAEQLSAYRGRVAHTADTLLRETGKEYPLTPPSPGRQFSIWDVFDVFNFMEYAILNATKAVNEGGDLGEVMKDFVQGLTMQERTDGGDLLESLGMEEGLGRTALGFGISVAVNPLTWLGTFGITKLGHLSMMKSMHMLDDVAAGSKLAAKVAKVFPGVPLKDAIARIPEIGKTWAEKAARKQMASVTTLFGGTPIVYGEGLLGALGQAGAAVSNIPVIDQFLRFWGNVKSKTAKTIMDSLRWKGTAETQEIIAQAAEMTMFCDRVGVVKAYGDRTMDVRELIVRLMEDPTLSVWANTVMADIDAEKVIPLASRVSAKYIKGIQTAVDSLTSAPENQELMSSLRVMLTDHGFTATSADEILSATMSVVETRFNTQSFLFQGPRTNVDNSFIRNALRTRREDFTFSPYVLDELFGIMDPDDYMQRAIREAGVDIRNLGRVQADRGALGILPEEALRDTFLGETSPLMKQRFVEIVSNIHAKRNATGLIGRSIDALSPEDLARGAKSERVADIFDLAVRTFHQAPESVLADNPELFGWLQSAMRMSNNGVLDPKFKLSKRMVAKAAAVREVTFGLNAVRRALTTADQGLNPKEAALLGRVRTRITGMLTADPKDARVPGPYRLMQRVLGGDPDDAIIKPAVYKTILSQVKGDLELTSQALRTRSTPVLRKLYLRGLLDTGDVAMILGVKDDVASRILSSPHTMAAEQAVINAAQRGHRGLTKMGRLFIDDKVNTALRDAAPAFAGYYSQKFPGHIKAFYEATGLRNAVSLITLSQASFAGKVGPRVQPIGTSLVDILDAMRQSPGGLVHPKTFEMAKWVEKKFTEWSVQEKALGILRSQIPHYFPHFATTDYLKQYSMPVSGTMHKGFSRELFAAKHRTTTGLIEDVNRGLYDLHGKAIEMFVSDPALAFALRGQAHARATTHAAMMREMAEKFGSKLPGGKLLAEESKTFMAATIPGMGTYKLPKDIGEYLTGFHRVMTNQDTLEGIGRTYKMLVNWYRGWTLGVFPAYHTRNIVSNVVNNIISGMPPGAVVENAVLAHRLQKYGPTLMDEFITTAAGKQVALSDVFEWGLERGVEGTGLMSAEVPESMLGTIQAAKRLGRAAKEGLGELPARSAAPARSLGREMKALSAQVEATGAGVVKQYVPLAGMPGQSKTLGYAFLVGRGIENNARWSQFIWSIKQGYTPDEAAQRVAKYLFDYSDVSTAVSKLRDYFPFIIWSRKNLPLQVVNNLKHPVVPAVTTTAKNFAEQAMLGGADAPSFPDLPEFIRENVPLSVARMPDGTYKYFLLGNWLSTTDLDRFLDPGQEVINMLFPGIRLPFEVASGYSFFFRNSIDRGVPFERKRFLGINMNPKTAHVLRSVRVLAEFNRLLGLDDSAKTDLMDRVLRFGFGFKLYDVDPEQEALKRYRKYSEGLGRTLAYDRIKKRQ